jgi:hypothetical protein
MKSSCSPTDFFQCQEEEHALLEAPRHSTSCLGEEISLAAKQRKRMISRVLEGACQVVSGDMDYFNCDDDGLPDDLSGIFD